jgi:aspartate ammonia-lyase
MKICGDLRLLSSGPQAGLGEIHLPEVQAGSSIMPGKVNPVIPEAVTQAAMLMMGHDATIAIACASGSLELNPFLPLIADCLLQGMEVLAHADEALAGCVAGITVDEARCRAKVESSTAAATALIPVLGYDHACELVRIARQSGRTLRDLVIESGVLTEAEYDRVISPEAVCRLGWEHTYEQPLCTVPVFEVQP